MANLKGQNLRLRLNKKYVAYATSCSIHLSANLEESSTKDSTNDYQEQEVTGVSWDISTDALYSVRPDANAMIGENMITLFTNPANRRVRVSFLVTKSSSEKNRSHDTGTMFYGWAWVSDIVVNAPNRQNATYTIQLTGDGELKAMTVASSSTIDEDTLLPDGNV